MKITSFLIRTWFRAWVLTAFAATLFFQVQAQTAPVKQWDKTIGGNDSEHLWSILQTSDGGYIMGGASWSGLSGDKTEGSRGGSDYWIVKLNSSGVKVWDKTFGGSAIDDFYSMQQTADGGYILGGVSYSGISGDKSEAPKGAGDYWVIKTDASGNKLWDKTIGGNGAELLTSLKQTSDGGYILGGVSESGISGDKTQPTKGGKDYWVVKLDASGNKVWDKTIGGSGTDNFSQLALTADGGFILGGGSDSGISGDKTEAGRGALDYWVVKLDGTGNIVWDKTIGGSGFDFLTGLQQTTDGGYILGGTSDSGISGDKTQAGKGSSDYWVVKLNASGTRLWDKTIGGSDFDEMFSLQQTTDGGFILGGTSSSGISGDKTAPGKGGKDYWIVKLDNSGTMSWNKTVGGNSGDELFSLQQTSDGGYILGGFSLSGISGDKSEPGKGNSDYWVVKLGPEITGLKDSGTTIRFSVSPNPGRGSFRLELNNLTSREVVITVSDLPGRIVMQQAIPVTENQVSTELNMSVSKGIYQVQVITGHQILTRKIIVE